MSEDIHFGTQPRPVVENATRRPPAGNLTCDLVSYSAEPMNRSQDKENHAHKDQVSENQPLGDVSGVTRTTRTTRTTRYTVATVVYTRG